MSTLSTLLVVVLTSVLGALLVQWFAISSSETMWYPLVIMYFFCIVGITYIMASIFYYFNLNNLRL